MGRGKGKNNEQERQRSKREMTEAEIGKGEEKVRENCIKSPRKSDDDLLTQRKERGSLCC